MASQRKEAYQQKRTVDSIFELIEDNASEGLLENAERTEIAYLSEYEEEALEYIKNKGKYNGVSTGYPHIDQLMGSFLPGELFTIGGDTGHGKSLLAMNIAMNVYQKTQEPVLMVNLELTRAQAVERFYFMSEDHDYAGIMVQRAPAVRYQDIDVLMLKAKEAGCVLVIIDHLHFFSRSAKDTVGEISRIMKHFKECAVEHNLPVILLSHVTPTRIMDQEGNVKKEYRPNLHSFKGSSSIEQDSDMVGFVYRSKERPTEVEFYMRKNRSRPESNETVVLTQEDWRLKEQWWPTKSEQFGGLPKPEQASPTPPEAVSMTL